MRSIAVVLSLGVSLKVVGVTLATSGATRRVRHFYVVAMSSKDDKTPKLIHEQFHGQRGPLFDQWALGYLDAAEGKGDDDASWAQDMQGLTVTAGLGAAQIKRRKVRLREITCMGK